MPYPSPHFGTASPNEFRGAQTLPHTLVIDEQRLLTYVVPLQSRHLDFSISASRCLHTDYTRDMWGEIVAFETAY